MLALACAGLFAITAGAAPAGVTATPKVAPLSPTPGAYLTFSSAGTFTVTPSAVSWNGTLYWSTDTTFWSVFTASGATAAPDNGAGEYKLHLCGSGNTYITGSSTSSPWLITAGNPVDCSGNIETLLDHATVADGEHPTMASCCFAYLFRDCAALASTPSLPATNLANHCYYNLFNGCTSLTSAPALPATILPERCYNGMFNGCTSLAQAPVLRATNLAESCYGYMFYKCSGLTSAPALPATNLADYCYNRMFYGCTGLTSAPALPATNLADYCYANMFNRCTGLTRAPALPATTLSERCYNGMFTSCTGLTNTPALPATTLAPYCYYYMFQSCTGLTRLPDLPATNLTDSCYRYMFYKCTGIELNTEGPGMPWSIPNNAIEATDWNLSMFADTSGTFKGAPVIGTTYYLASGAPDAPTFATDGTALVFGDGTVAIKIDNAESGVWYTLYAVDDLSDPDWTNVGSIRATGSTVVFTIPRDATVPRRFFKVAASFTAP